jgi:beta-lactamase class C
MKIITLLLFSLVCLISQASQVLSASEPRAALPPLMEQQLADRYEAYFIKQVADESITGAAFAVATAAGIIRIGTAGYTDTSRNKSIDENTTFRIASVSKTFAAGLTGLLVNEGEFEWEDRVVDYVPA